MSKAALRQKMIARQIEKYGRPLRLRERGNILTDSNLVIDILLEEYIALEKRVKKLEDVN